MSDGFLLNSRYLVMDRDTIYTDDYRGHLDREGVKPVRCPARTPNCNAFAERFVRSIKEECLDRMILFGEASLRRALREYVAHYYSERNHQGVDNRLLEPLVTVSSTDEPIQCRERLGVCSQEQDWLSLGIQVMINNPPGTGCKKQHNHICGRHTTLPL